MIWKKIFCFSVTQKGILTRTPCPRLKFKAYTLCHTKLDCLINTLIISSLAKILKSNWWVSSPKDEKVELKDTNIPVDHPHHFRVIKIKIFLKYKWEKNLFKFQYLESVNIKYGTIYSLKFYGRFSLQRRSINEMKHAFSVLWGKNYILQLKVRGFPPAEHHVVQHT